MSSLERAHSGRLTEVGSLETNRGVERKLGQEDPVDRKSTQNGPDDQEVWEKLENGGRSSSGAGEISELLGNSVGLSFPAEEPVESEDKIVCVCETTFD